MLMNWWVVVHVVGTVFGVGAATINDILFMRAIGSPDEGEAYRRYSSTLSLVAWVGVALLVISAIAFWDIKPGILQSQKVLVKIALTALVAGNGLLMSLLLMPHVRRMKPADWTNPTKLGWAVLPGALLGAISIVSWYALLLLGAIGRTGWTATQILPWYAAALILAWISGTFLVRRRILKLDQS